LLLTKIIKENKMLNEPLYFGRTNLINQKKTRKLKYEISKK